MLQWVGVDGSYSHGGCPFVVDLVKVFVESGVVKQPKGRGGEGRGGEREERIW